MHLLRRLYAAGILATICLVVGADFLPGRILDVTSTPRWGSIVAFVLGGAACFTPAWQAMRHLVTFLHETGHAVVALWLGGRVRRITLAADGSGLATYALPLGWGLLRRTAATAAGYLAPGFAGVVAAAAVPGGVSRVFLAAGAVWFAAAVPLLVRSGFGWRVGVVGAAAWWIVLRYSPGWAPGGIAAALGGILTVGAVRASVIQLRALDLDESDAGTIGTSLHLPARLVAAVQTLLCTASVVYAAYLLIGHH
jgi:hypothetical protein